MRAISLWEPWGTAIALGLKGNETRGWSTGYRGPIAIHCAKTKDYAEFIRDPSVAPYFQEKGIFRTTQLSFGCVIAVCELTSVIAVETVRDKTSPQELAFGNYDDGRFAWRLEKVRMLAAPVPFKGKQGFFHVPDELLA